MSLRSSRRLALSLGFCLSMSAVAAETPPDLRISGFLTQGYMLTDHNRIYGDSEHGSLDFRELAVNASWRVRPDLRLAGQLMSRRAGAVDDGTPQVDYLLLDWRAQDTARQQAGLRVGRLKVPYGLYNDTRDVAFTRPSILLPQEIYYDRVRDLALSIDGVGVYRQLTNGDYRLDLDLLYGRPKRDKSVEYTYLLGNQPGRFDSGDAWILRLMAGDTLERWRAGLSLLHFGLDYDAGAGPSLPLEPTDGRLAVGIAVLSAQYNWERWSLASEYMWQHIDWSELGAEPLLQPGATLEAYYLQAQYLFRPRWDLVLRYGEGYLDRNDRSGRGFHDRLAAVGVDVPGFLRYSRDLTAGIGWRPSPEWLLRAELHRVQGALWLPGQDNPDSSKLYKRWNLFALQASYRF